MWFQESIINMALTNIHTGVSPPSILFFNLSNISGLELLDLIKRFLEVPKSLISHVQ